VQVKWKGMKDRDFRLVSRFISQTKQYMVTVTMEAEYIGTHMRFIEWRHFQ